MNKYIKQFFLTPHLLLIAIIGITLSFIFFTMIQIKEDNQLDEKFERIFERQVNSFQRELDLDVQILKSIKYFYSSSNEVDREEFRTFTKNFLQEYKSIKALEWILYIPHEKREFYEKKASQELKQTFTIKEKSTKGEMVTANKRAEYFPIYFIEPLKGNEKALGFDLASDEIRIKSLNKSSQSREMTVTDKITLIQENQQHPGILIFVPIWNNSNSQKLEGFISGAYRIKDMITKANNYNKEEAKMLEIWLIDETNPNKKQILFSNTLTNEFDSHNSQSIKLYNKSWKMYAKPSKLFYKQNNSFLALLVLISGLIITFLTVYIFSLKINKNLELIESVNQKTKALQESNEKFSKLFEMFDDRVIASRTNIKGDITYVSKAFIEVCGYSKDELIGKSHNIVRDPSMPKEFYIGLWHTIKSGEIFKADIKNKRKNGEAYWVDTVIIPEFNENKEIISYFSVRKDITSKKNLELLNHTLHDEIEKGIKENRKKDQLLLEQAKLAAMGEMIGAIAHQWRQPLNTLALKIQFIEDDFEDQILDKEYIDEFTTSCMGVIDFMSNTINDFRKFFILEKEKNKFSVSEKIEKTLALLQAQLDNFNIKIQFIKEKNFIFGFENEFQQVILNLINNAKDAILENNISEGEIIIMVKNDNQNNVIITIEDNAKGIPQNIIGRIFEPYFTTKEEGKGTGLGLYLSKIIIEDNMNGKISVNNTQQGAIFKISLEVSNDNLS